MKGKVFLFLLCLGFTNLNSIGDLKKKDYSKHCHMKMIDGSKNHNFPEHFFLLKISGRCIYSHIQFKVTTDSEWLLININTFFLNSAGLYSFSSYAEILPYMSKILLSSSFLLMQIFWPKKTPKCVPLPGVTRNNLIFS